MSWYLAHSLETLRGQIDRKYPSRDKSSDGTIGDQAHQNTKSDHNPDADGCVKAMDITHDTIDGVDCNALAEMLRASKDYRISYIIWNKQISNPDIDYWAWRPYTGSNPHTLHLHLSVKKDGSDDPQYWTAAPVPPLLEAKPAGPMPKLARGQKGLAVEVLQSMIGIPVDGFFGKGTEDAVKAKQTEAHLVVDGIVGNYTWDALARDI